MMHIKREIKATQNFQSTFKPACSKAFIIKGNYEWMSFEEFKKYAAEHPENCCKKCLNKI